MLHLPTKVTCYRLPFPHSLHERSALDAEVQAFSNLRIGVQITKLIIKR